MPDLAGFGEIAPYLTHPLVVAGFGLLLFFGLLQAPACARALKRGP
jgi:hypothetical protein